jgi:LacI family transcriptional regulator
MASIRDVAAKAGVSTATVSHVINRTQYVSPLLTKRVLAAMEELNYHPSAVARSLRIQQTNTIGLVVSDVELPHFTAIVRGVQDVAEKNGFTVIVGNSDEKQAKEDKYLQVVWSRRVDGIIISPVGNSDKWLAKVRTQVPVILIDRLCPGLEAPVVMANNLEPSYRAVKFLIAKGHRKIAFLGGLTGLSSIQERLKGYRQALSESGIETTESLVKFTDSKAQQGKALTYQLLRGDPRPTAIFAVNSDLALGALSALHEIGLNCPDDVSIVGFDDPPWAAVSTPALTCIRQPSYKIGQEATLLLLRILRKEVVSYQTESLLLPTGFIERTSVSSPRIGHSL